MNKISLLIALAAAVVSIALLAYGKTGIGLAATSSNTVTANVAVGNVIYLSVSPNTINFGTLYPAGTAYDTNAMVTDNDIGGNMGANILVEGTAWAETSNTANTFGVSNTLWDASSQTTYAGTALTSTFANTMIFIHAPSLSTPTTSNNIYFGLSIPGATPAGTYTQNIIFENYNVTYGITNQPSTANVVVASVTVGGTCYISLSPNTISFGSVYAGANVPTNMLVTDTDNGGNVAANVLVYGGNWIGPAQFGVSNTLWDASSQTTYAGTPLTLTASPTGITVPAPTPTATSTNAPIYFGLGVPGGAPAGTYTQNIIIENSC